MALLFLENYLLTFTGMLHL